MSRCRIVIRLRNGSRTYQILRPGRLNLSALEAASCWGHEKVAQMLLGKGAGVNAQGGENSNVLQAASVEGHEKAC